MIVKILLIFFLFKFEPSQIYLLEIVLDPPPKKKGILSVNTLLRVKISLQKTMHSWIKLNFL